MIAAHNARLHPGILTILSNARRSSLDKSMASLLYTAGMHVGGITSYIVLPYMLCFISF